MSNKITGWCSECMGEGIVSEPCPDCDGKAFWRPPVVFYYPEGDDPMPFPEQDLDPYEGWDNQATFCFNMYFMQERENYDALHDLITNNGTLNYRRAFQLLRSVYNNGKMLAIDPHTKRTGNPLRYYVNVKEIVDTFLADFVTNIPPYHEGNH